jgi:hypothetical protein
MSPVPKSVVLFPLDFLKLFNESPQNARLLSFGRDWNLSGIGKKNGGGGGVELEETY